MPEILTESFCERCGTRYTFESAAPKQKRLGRFKVLSQGFKNFVMSDDTSLDEAFAAARNDEERETVTQQLDAFHKTFNFCMNCRQYTCSNCWNEIEGRCLTCAPHLGHEILPAPFPALDANGNGAGTEDGPYLDGLAWPTLDLPPEPTAATLAWPEASEPAARVEAGRAAEVPSAPAAREDGLPDWAALTTAPTGLDEAATAAEAVEPVAPPDLDTLLAHPPEPVEAEAIAPEQPVAATDEAPLSALAPENDERVTAAAAQTAELLARFRPGQSIDAALDEFEATLAAQEGAIQPEPAATVEVPAAELEPPTAAVEVTAAEVETAAGVPETAAPEPAPQPVAAAAELEPETVGAVDEVLAEEPPLEAEIAAAIVETEPEPATRPPSPADDRIEVPVWRIVAPDGPTPAVNGHPAEPTFPAAASAEQPHWPQQPAWPGQEAPVDVSFLAARLSRKPANDALWAASAQDVVAPLPQQPAQPAVQTCVSCGLSLSASARFCRRCGSRQGG
jgi:hypothetical protein